MKKLLASILTLFVLTGSAFAFTPNEWVGYSATKTADALIHTGEGWFYGFVCKTDATNAVTFKIYDSTAGSGTRVGPDFICVTSAANRMCVFDTGPGGIPFSTGLFIDITSTDASPDYTIFYRSK
jgi:hypothetical protein